MGPEFFDFGFGPYRYEACNGCDVLCGCGEVTCYTVDDSMGWGDGESDM